MAVKGMKKENVKKSKSMNDISEPACTSALPIVNNASISDFKRLLFLDLALNQPNNRDRAHTTDEMLSSIKSTAALAEISSEMPRSPRNNLSPRNGNNNRTFPLMRLSFIGSKNASYNSLTDFESDYAYDSHSNAPFVEDIPNAFQAELSPLAQNMNNGIMSPSPYLNAELASPFIAHFQSLNPTQALYHRFQSRLSCEIGDVFRRFQKESKGKDRTHLLEDLFYNLSCQLEDSVYERLRPNNDSLPEKPVHYFEILADWYSVGYGHAEALALQPLATQLWSHETFPAIYALLFYSWLLNEAFDSSSQTKVSTVVSSRFNVLIQGSYMIFWYDLQNSLCKFRGVYNVFKRYICQENSNVIFSRFKREIAALVSRFFFYYDDASQLSELLDTLPLIDEAPLPPNVANNETNASAFETLFLDQDSSSKAKLLGMPQSSISNNAEEQQNKDISKCSYKLIEAADSFVNLNIKHIRAITNEKALLIYIKGMSCLAGFYVSVHTYNRLQIGLHEFTTPGGPLFPTKKLRETASHSMNVLFPWGRSYRDILSTVYHFLHPYYLLSSIGSMIQSYIRSVTNTILAPYRVTVKIISFLSSFSPISFTSKKQT